MKILSRDKRKIRTLENKIDSMEKEHIEKITSLEEEIFYLKQRIDYGRIESVKEMRTLFNEKIAEYEDIIEKAKECRTRYELALKETLSIKKVYKNKLNKEIKKTKKDIK